MTAQSTQRARNVGSNYTTFRYRGNTIAYLESISDTGQVPVGRGFEAIQPLGYEHATEIVVANAIQPGTLTIRIKEMWHQEVWQQLTDLAGTTDIVKVFRKVSGSPNPISCSKIIHPPTGSRYGYVYHNCVITSIADGEDILLETLSVTKPLTIMYTHKTQL